MMDGSIAPEALPPDSMINVVLVSGLAGAGRSSILRALEDLGYQAVDNLPLWLLPELVRQSRKEGARLAVGIDTRSKGFDPACLLGLRDDLSARTGPVHLVVATAANDVLLRRFTETRRRHPLAPEGQVIDGIEAERALVAPLQAVADLVIDTSDLPLAGLRRAVEGRYGHAAMGVTLVSFAFPNGLPREADMVFDARFLRNPHYDQALRPLTGLDPRVAAYVEADNDFEVFFDKMTGMLKLLLPRFVREGKKYVVIAVGCSGGKHRSVHIVQRLAAFLNSSAMNAGHEKSGHEKTDTGAGNRKTGPEWRVAVMHRELARLEARMLGSDQAQV